jgi:restriction endonuclease S subunit
MVGIMLFAKLNDLSIGGKGSYGIAASAVERKADLPTYLRITDIFDDGTLNLSELKSVDAPNSDKYILKPNDIVFARTGGSTGRNYFYDGSDGVFVYAGFLIKFSIDPEKVNPKYVKYYCRSKQYNDWVQSFNTGSTRGNINAQTFGNMEIPLPERKQQDYLVSILEPIDEKIRNNKQVNDNLEQQAQAIYHERFETVSPNDLPSDWRIVTLGEVATISNKSFNPLKEPEILLEHYSIPAFDEARFPVFELSTSIKSNKFIIDASCFMISKLNPTTKRVWKPYCLTGNAVCSTEFIVYKAKDQSITDFLYSVIDSGSFSDFMCSHVTGSTGSRQRTTPSDTLSYELILPSEDELAEFQSLVSPMYAQMRINAIENDKLKRLRDSLLPKLMSGEIDVSSVHL